MAFNPDNFQLSLPNPLEAARFAVEKITDTFLGQVRNFCVDFISSTSIY